MNHPTRKVREMAVQLLYSMNEGEKFHEETFGSLMSLFEVSKKKIFEITDRVKTIFEQRSELDKEIEAVSEDYALGRISKIDLAILRLMIFEMKIEELPVEVAVSEALRIAKKYSNYGSGKYLHAIIDSIHKGERHEEESIC